MGFLILMLIAAVGFLASAICHGLSWFGLEPPGGHATLCLHVGIFVVWFPLVLFANRTMPKGSRSNIDHLLAELPAWVNKVFTILFFYCILNFFYFILCTSKYPKHQVPFYLELRGFSGMWMAFYGYATIGFAGLARKRKQEMSASPPASEALH
jgi:hypothetical protein